MTREGISKQKFIPRLYTRAQHEIRLILIKTQTKSIETHKHFQFDRNNHSEMAYTDKMEMPVGFVQNRSIRLRYRSLTHPHAIRTANAI